MLLVLVWVQMGENEIHVYVIYVDSGHEGTKRICRAVWRQSDYDFDLVFIVW